MTDKNILKQKRAFTNINAKILCVCNEWYISMPSASCSPLLPFILLNNNKSSSYNSFDTSITPLSIISQRGTLKILFTLPVFSFNNFNL